EPAEIRRGDGGGPESRAAGFGLSARPLERGDAVVQGPLVPLELGETLRRCPRAAPRLLEARLALALERQEPLQLVGALCLATGERVARVHQPLALARDTVPQLEHVVRQQAVLAAHEIEIL